MEPTKTWFRLWRPILFRVILVTFFVLPLTSEAAEYNFAWPVQGADTAGISTLAKEAVPPYLNRKGRIGVDLNLLAAAETLQPGDSLSLNFFDDSPYKVTVTSVKHGSNGVVTIMGNIEGEKLSTFVLTGSSENYLMTLQDLNKNMLYRVSGDMLQGEGSVSEIDQKKMPQVIHLPPLIPKR